MTFYNTTNLTGDNLKDSHERAKTQDEKIIEFFRRYPDVNYTPFEVQERLKMWQTPITSIRRSITNLTDTGLLEKTDIQRQGMYGKANYAWRLKLIKQQLELNFK